jgi:transposase-like protein
MARKSYTSEFRESTVKMVLEQKRQVNETARSLGVLPTTLRYWIKTHRQETRSADSLEEKGLRNRLRELDAEGIAINTVIQNIVETTMADARVAV